MELLLTSFGLWPPQNDRNTLVFDGFDLLYRMPPVSMRHVPGHFSLEYSELLLCDKIVVDSVTFDRLQNNPHPLYMDVANTIKILFDEGYVRLVDFDSILDRNRALLSEILTLDMGNIGAWLHPLVRSCDIWEKFVSQVVNILSMNRPLPFIAAISLAKKTKGNIFRLLDMYKINPSNFEDPKVKLLQDIVSDAVGEGYENFLYDHLLCTIQNYLNYVNANLVLSAELDIPFHDWADLSPFYETKFKLVGQKRRKGEPELSKVNQLFEIAFPRLAIQDVGTLLKILNDSRIQDLRNLVSEAVKGDIVFDEEFANKILSDVLNIEFSLTHIRKLISYLTIPLSLIPLAGTFLQKGVEEIASSLAERRLRRPYRWFYLISDIVDS